MRYLILISLFTLALLPRVYSQKKAGPHYATAYQAGNLVSLDTLNGNLKVGKLSHIVPYAQLFRDSLKKNNTLNIRGFESKYGLEPDHLDRIYKADTDYQYYAFKEDSFTPIDKQVASLAHFYTPGNDNNEYNEDSINNSAIRKALSIPDSMRYIADEDTEYSRVQIFYATYFDVDIDGKPELAIFYGFDYASEVSSCQTGNATIGIYQQINKKWKLYQSIDCSFINGCDPSFSLIHFSKNSPPVIMLTERGFDYNDNDFVNRTFLVPRAKKVSKLNVISLLN